MNTSLKKVVLFSVVLLVGQVVASEDSVHKMSAHHDKLATLLDTAKNSADAADALRAEQKLQELYREMEEAQRREEARLGAEKKEPK